MTKEFKYMWFKVESEEQFNELIKVLEGLGYCAYSFTDRKYSYILESEHRVVSTYTDGEFTNDKHMEHCALHKDTTQFIKEHIKEK
jgi:ArsR family metal-binding transcriptional regulator